MPTTFPRVETTEEFRRELARLSQEVALLREVSPVSTETSPALRIVRGIVTSAGAVLEGAGFSSAKTGTGAYTVTFTPAFSDVPAFVVTQTLQPIYRINGTPTASSVDVVSATLAGANADGGFHFIAIGPAG